MCLSLVPRLPGIWVSILLGLEQSQGDTMKDVSLCVCSCFLVTMGHCCVRSGGKEVSPRVQLILSRVLGLRVPALSRVAEDLGSCLK